MIEVKQNIIPTTNSSNSWIAYRWKCQTPSVRLFCFPYAGGSASIFYEWKRFLPNNIELCAIQLPGRGKRVNESPYRNFCELVESLSKGIKEYLDMPFVFFGHSLGALINFELGCYLKSQKNRSPDLVIASASLPPMYAVSKKRVRVPIDQLSDEEFCAELKRLGGTSEEILQNPEIMATFMPILRADFGLLESYIPKANDFLECPMAIFGGCQDIEVPMEMLKFWSDCTTRAVHIREFEGGHFFLHSQLERVIKAIVEELEIGFLL